MTLLTIKQLRRLQKIGEMGMNVHVTVHRLQPQAKDPDNPYGDSDVQRVTGAVKVKGWLVTKPVERFNVGQGQVRTLSTHQLRVPVGTIIRPNDEVTVRGSGLSQEGERFVVTDVTNEQSWPEWTVCYLRGYA
jgi:hypothetical protein